MAKLEFIQDLIRPLDERFSICSPKFPLTSSADDLSDQLIAQAIDEVERLQPLFLTCSRNKNGDSVNVKNRISVNGSI